MSPYSVYILQCADGTYYVGVTNDVRRRLLAHNSLAIGAKYTRGRRPVRLVFQEQFATKSEALKREYEIKTWTRTNKENFISNQQTVPVTPSIEPDTSFPRHSRAGGEAIRPVGNPEIKTNKNEPPYSPGSLLSTSFEPIIRINPRAKHIRLTVYPDSRVVVTVPRPTSEKIINKFISEKSDWIAKQLKLFKKAKPSGRLVDDKKSFKAYKDSALRLVERRIKHFNKYYQFAFSDIKITNTKTQWGSCSATRVLSFNYRIAFIAPNLADYLIVHELCHLKEFNHSPRFWKLVEELIPDYKTARTELKKEGFSLY